jgi:hypothetical protein
MTDSFEIKKNNINVYLTKYSDIRKKRREIQSLERSMLADEKSRPYLREIRKLLEKTEDNSLMRSSIVQTSESPFAIKRRKVTQGVTREESSSEIPASESLVTPEMFAIAATHAEKKQRTEAQKAKARKNLEKLKERARKKREEGSKVTETVQTSSTSSSSASE